MSCLLPRTKRQLSEKPYAPTVFIIVVFVIFKFVTIIDLKIAFVNSFFEKIKKIMLKYCKFYLESITLSLVNLLPLERSNI